MRRKFSVASAMQDTLFNILLGFFILLMLAMTLVNPPAKKKDIELKAEFMVTMEWPDGSHDDLDLVVISPLGNVVFYGRPNTQGLSLDRDDRGMINDVITLGDGTKLVVQENWEHITIRKNIPGEFIVNIRMFRKTDKTPTPVTVKVTRLNPYSVVFVDTIEMTYQRQEETAIRFTIDGTGKILDTSTVPVSTSSFMRRGR